MWLAIQSVYNGTWGSGAIPQEIVDFEICHEMHISLEQYERMSPYVRRVWWDCIMAKREAEQEQQERQQRKHGNDGKTHVRW